MNHSRKILIGLLILVILAAGYGREIVFVKTNALIQQIDARYSIEGDWSRSSLMTFKWVMTFMFSGFYLGISMALVWLLFKSKTFVQITVLFYAIFFLISLLFFGSGYLFTDPETAYSMSRSIMGMVQSPVMIMLLIPAFYFARRISQKDSS